MADFNSSLPVRTEQNGDVAAKIVDGAIPSQALSVDSSGKIHAKLSDGSGTEITSQVNGAQQALDVGINVGGVQIDPRDVRALTSADVVTAEQGTSPWITKDQADGPVAPGTVAAFSQLAGAQYNSTPPTLTDGQQAALQVDSSGKLLVNTSNDDDHNYGTVGANTIRTAAQIGNATGAADFDAGATSAQTLRVAANVYDSTGAAISTSNPLPVSFTNPAGTHVNDYKDAAAIAAAATDNHDYTVTAGKTLYLSQIEATASGKAKMTVSVETAAGSGTFVVKFVQFNSTANTNMSIHLDDTIPVAAGVRVRVAMQNRDLLSQDLYSTICGNEI